MSLALDRIKKMYQEAVKYCDLETAKECHQRIAQMESEESKAEQYDPIYSGLDPVQVEYAKIVAAQLDANTLAMQQMWLVDKGDPWANINFKSPPGSVYPTGPSIAGPVSGAAAGGIHGMTTGAVPPGNNVVFRSSLKPMAIFKEPTQADKDTDKRRHLKLFVHFAKQFAEHYPQWTVVPDPADPLHSVHLLRKDMGAMIHNLYPSNEMAVYGGPASWTDPRKELGQPLPIVKINTQEFWGWCVGMDDVPEWMIL